MSTNRILERLMDDHVEFTTSTFTEATPQSSLIKLRGEIDELEKALNSEPKENVLEEYVDCFMCLTDSAKRAGFTSLDINLAFEKKLNKNLSRKWVKNPDNTYSHVK